MNSRRFVPAIPLPILIGLVVVLYVASAFGQGPAFLTKVYLNTCAMQSGSGTPESAVTGGVCDLFLRTNGTDDTTLYVKTSGSGTTGWRPMITSRRDWIGAGWCQNATAGSTWSTPTTNPAVLACNTGTNTQKATWDFADGANTLSIQTNVRLPGDFSGTVDVNLRWFTSATTGDVVWQVQSVCVADGETSDPAFNTASTVTDTAKGTTLQDNEAAISSLDITGCAASEILYLRVFRDPTNGSDTLAATAQLRGIELIYRRG